MKQCLITFRSITYAQRGERALTTEGIQCNLRRTPRWMEEQGCGYSLALDYREAPGAVALLRLKQVPFRKVYLRKDGERTEEVSL